MKTIRSLAVIAAVASFAPIARGQSGPPPVPPAVLQGMRGVAYDAAQNCVFLHDNARRVSIRSSQQGQALAAIVHLKDAAKKFADATTADRWPRPDWLRVCSERLLDSWMGVDQTFPMLAAPPPVVDWWNRAQTALVALYNAAAPYIGRPAGGPMPLALGGGGIPAGSPPPVGTIPAQPTPAMPPPRALPPGTYIETVPISPGAVPIVR